MCTVAQLAIPNQQQQPRQVSTIHTQCEYLQSNSNNNNSHESNYNKEKNNYNNVTHNELMLLARVPELIHPQQSHEAEPSRAL